MSRDERTAELTLLVVDDNEDDILLLEESLIGQRGARIVHVAHNGDEALEFLRRQGPFAQAPRPAIVLLDINMPGRNGFEVLSEMRSDAVLRRIPVVMLTTSTREADVAAAYEGGACSFIAKPVSLDDLRDLLIHFIRYWLRVARLPRQEG